MAQNGNIIVVYKDSTLIGGMKSNSIKTEAELEEISSPTQGQWKQYITGRLGGSIQIGYLVLSTSALGISGGNGIRDVLQAGNTFTLKFKTRGATDSTGVSGSFILKSVDIQATRGNLVTGTFQFVLNGALT